MGSLLLIISAWQTVIFLLSSSRSLVTTLSCVEATVSAMAMCLSSILKDSSALSVVMTGGLRRPTLYADNLDLTLVSPREDQFLRYLPWTDPTVSRTTVDLGRQLEFAVFTSPPQHPPPPQQPLQLLRRPPLLLQLQLS